jgi:CRISPR-associated protein Cmr5
VKGREEKRPPDAEPVRTAEQRRAANAMAAVPSNTEGNDLRKRYRAYAERFGPSILMNGLGQALATERAAAGSKPTRPEERAHDLLYKNVQAWLCRAGGVYAQRADLLDAIVAGSEALYMRAQAEALAWLIWHKKFCRALLPSSEEP